ncbi:redoxin domain-containing protein [Oceanobacillus saliphilus]|uniref:redoxin domain-containing protein n=1 Tax=Oceanobacillus saliphilus TaxID=2925834 RepID=UPI00201E7321|nr:redoxin domain-containing protein [Oceanobacillus saliphilus]
MKKGILMLLIVGMVGWALYDFIASDNQSPNQAVNEDVQTGLEKGDMAPDFELATLDGEPARLSDYRGKHVFINFWATWCPPCRAEMPDMQKLYENEDIEILAVNLTQSESSEEVVKTFVEDFALTFPILMDVDAEVSTTYKVQAYPTSYLIDSNGRIQYIALGAMNYDLMVQEFGKMD